MPTQVLVPPLGQTVDTMNFVAWLKREGEFVREGEALYVIETDKAMLDVEAPATGALAAVSAKQGDEVKALSRIALILGEGESAPPAEESPVGPAEGAPARVLTDRGRLRRRGNGPRAAWRGRSRRNETGGRREVPFWRRGAPPRAHGGGA